MTQIGIIGIIIGCLVLLSAWVSPRLFRIFILILGFLLGTVAVTGIGILFLTLGHPVFALPILSIVALGGFLFIFKRRALILWIIATLYLILVLPISEAWPLLLGIPGGVMTWFITLRAMEGIRNRKTMTGQSNNTPGYLSTRRRVAKTLIVSAGKEDCFSWLESLICQYDNGSRNKGRDSTPP